MSLAVLNGFTLPCHFHYEPLIAEKRINYKKTAKGIVAQRSITPIIEEGPIPFSIVAVSNLTVKAICIAYNETAPITFTGYYGEDYLVDMISLSPSVAGGIHTFEGVLQVVCTIVPYCPPPISC